MLFKAEVVTFPRVFWRLSSSSGVNWGQTEGSVLTLHKDTAGRWLSTGQIWHSNEMQISHRLLDTHTHTHTDSVESVLQQHMEETCYLSVCPERSGSSSLYSSAQEEDSRSLCVSTFTLGSSAGELRQDGPVCAAAPVSVYLASVWRTKRPSSPGLPSLLPSPPLSSPPSAGEHHLLLRFKGPELHLYTNTKQKERTSTWWGSQTPPNPLRDFSPGLMAVRQDLQTALR